MRGRVAVALSIVVAVTQGCSASTTEESPPLAKATITIVSGADQTVSLATSPNARLPQPVVVQVVDEGPVPLLAAIRTQVTMRGAPGSNEAVYFSPDPTGRTPLDISVSPSVGAFDLRIEYGTCGGFKTCEPFASRTSTSTSGNVVR